MNKKYLLFGILLLSLLVVTGCTKPISEITATDDYVGKTVSVRGTAEGVTKIGSLSGYTLIDSNDDSIIVSSDSLPADGETVTAKGTLLKGPLGISYYIDTK